jgi:hypothetical protein
MCGLAAAIRYLDCWTFFPWMDRRVKPGDDGWGHRAAGDW